MAETLQAPGADEFEVSVFGRGHGESVVVHVGDGRWLIIDSLLDAQGHSVPLRYLQSLGVDVATAVDLVVATHWHDDHIRGLAQAFAVATSAKISFPVAMMQQEFRQFANNLRQTDIPGITSGVRELGELMNISFGRVNSGIEWCMSWRTLLDYPQGIFGHGQHVHIQSISPSTGDVTSFLQALRISNDAPIGSAFRAPRYRQNDVSAAMWIKVGSATVLLGADLETTRSPNSGWDAILSASQCQALRKMPAQVLKIPHHGSKTGHHSEVWSELCASEVIATLAPWAIGGKRLPTSEDVSRLRGLTPNGFSTSPSPTTREKERPSRMPNNFVVNKGVKIRRLTQEIGQVRHRLAVNTASADWQTDLFGTACKMAAVAA